MIVRDLVVISQQLPPGAAARAEAATGASVEMVADLAGLEAALARPRARACRVLSVLNRVVLPARLLDALDEPAYNIHPGPPEFPGVAPEAFALYAGATSFGVTAHRMTARVDDGPIVAMLRFPIPPGLGRMALARAAGRAVWQMFGQIVPRLAGRPAPLGELTERWGGRRTTSADYARACALSPDMTAEEVERRIRAFGDGSPGQFHIDLHGRRFFHTAVGEA
jgi:methionyl-tRNA formyltransferase